MTKFTTNDKVLLRTFIEANPVFLAALNEAAPACQGVTTEERAMTGSERQGWQNAVAYIQQLMQDTPQSDQTESLPA